MVSISALSETVVEPLVHLTLNQIPENCQSGLLKSIDYKKHTCHRFQIISTVNT